VALQALHHIDKKSCYTLTQPGVVTPIMSHWETHRHNQELHKHHTESLAARSWPRLTDQHTALHCKRRSPSINQEQHKHQAQTTMLCSLRDAVAVAAASLCVIGRYVVAMPLLLLQVCSPAGHGCQHFSDPCCLLCLQL
jgi:Flp pilus assembly protein TadB